MPDRKQLEEAIRTLESQRAILGDEVVDSSLAILREKLTARRAPRRWLGRPLPLALSTAVAGALVAVIWLGGGREPNRLDGTSPEELVLGRRLDMLRQYEVFEQLDLLEDFEVIGDLDRLTLRGEG